MHVEVLDEAARDALRPKDHAEADRIVADIFLREPDRPGAAHADGNPAVTALACRREALVGFLLAVDIGLHGAIALIDESGELIAAYDMPCLADGSTRGHAVCGHWRNGFRRDRALGFVTHDYTQRPSPGGAS